MTDYAAIAAGFALALVSGDFTGAHAMLSPTLQTQYTPEQLKEEYQGLLPDTEKAFDTVETSVDNQMEEWPDKQADDAGWAYVSIFQDKPDATFVEAVTVIVTKDGYVRDLVWGRP
jgi:hypothetical protein